MMIDQLLRITNFKYVDSALLWRIGRVLFCPIIPSGCPNNPKQKKKKWKFVGD